MTAKSTILSMLILFTCVPGCSTLMDHGSAAKPDQGQVAGTLPEIKKDCTICHTSGDVRKGTAQLKKPVTELCLDCHPGRKSPTEHKVDIVPSMKVKQLPLTEGKMTCVTCHDPHRNPYGKMLRARKRDLCILCHPY